MQDTMTYTRDTISDPGHKTLHNLVSAQSNIAGHDC